MPSGTEIGIMVALIGCFVGLAGWISGRDKKISDDAEWKGKTDQKLDNIQSCVSGIDGRMAKMEGAISALNTQNALHATKLKEHDDQIQELKQRIAEQEKTA